jgi:spermidine synthase
LFGTWFAGRNWLEQLAAGAPLNTDDRPVVLFEAPHTLEGRGTVGWTLLQQLLDRPRPFPEAPFQGTRDVDRVWRDRLFHFHEARDLYLRGLIADATGQRAEAVDAFVGSARLSAEFTTGYAQVLARAAQVAKSDPALARSMLERLSSARPERTVAEDLRRRLGL